MFKKFRLQEKSIWPFLFLPDFQLFVTHIETADHCMYYISVYFWPKTVFCFIRLDIILPKANYTAPPKCRINYSCLSFNKVRSQVVRACEWQRLQTEISSELEHYILNADFSQLHTQNLKPMMAEFESNTSNDFQSPNARGQIFLFFVAGVMRL